MTINIVIGIFGYLSTLNDTPHVFIDRDDPDSFKPDITMIIGKIFYMVVLITSTTFNLHPCKYSILEAIGKRDSLTADRVTTCVIIWVSFLVAVVYPYILGVLSIVGGISVLGLSLAIPMALHWHGEKRRWLKIINLIWVVAFGLLMFTSLVITIIYI
jgi:amino acid permease